MARRDGSTHLFAGSSPSKSASVKTRYNDLVQPMFDRSTGTLQAVCSAFERQAADVIGLYLARSPAAVFVGRPRNPAFPLGFGLGPVLPLSTGKKNGNAMASNTGGNGHQDVVTGRTGGCETPRKVQATAESHR